MSTLRRAGPDDSAALTVLRGHMHRAMGEQISQQWEGVCEQALRRRLATETFVAFVVEQHGEAVSGGVGWLEEHLPSPSLLDARRGHVASMSTLPHARRQGHGRAVLSALMGWFADRGVPRVDLRATGDGRPLYEQAGFATLGGSTMAWFAEGGRPGMPGTPG